MALTCQEAPEEEREKRTAQIIDSLNEAAVLQFSENLSPEEYCAVLSKKIEGLSGELVIAPVFSSWTHDYI